MSHPFASARQHLVEKSRVAGMCKGYAAGGAVASPSAAAVKPKRATGGSVSSPIEGRKSGGRLDKFARGGAVKKGATNVNVIIAPQGGGAAAPPVVGLPPPIPAGPPPMPAGAMPPGGPPGMGQRHGGRAYASGGSVKEQSVKAGTPVMNSPGKSDLGDIYRGKQITYAKGGRAYPIKDGAGSGPGRLEKVGKRT